MDQKTVEIIKQKIMKQFPNLKGTEPEILNHGNDFLFVFKTLKQTKDGKALHQQVRVVATDDGEIIKVSMSR